MAAIMALVTRKQGATGKELVKATGWATHGWASTLEKDYGPRFGLKFKSVESGDETRYVLTK